MSNFHRVIRYEVMFSIQLGRWDRFQSFVTIYRGSSDNGWIISFSIFNKLIWLDSIFCRYPTQKRDCLGQSMCSLSALFTNMFVMPDLRHVLHGHISLSFTYPGPMIKEKHTMQSQTIKYAPVSVSSLTYNSKC